MENVQADAGGILMVAVKRFGDNLSKESCQPSPVNPVAALPVHSTDPLDVTPYSDDPCVTGEMYFSPSEFHDLFLPQLNELVDHLRTLTSAPILFHDHGAIDRILPDILKLGADILNLDPMPAEWGRQERHSEENRKPCL